MEKVAEPNISLSDVVGAQNYAYHLFTGCRLVSGEKEYELFTNKETDPDIWSKFLTNAKDTGQTPAGQKLIVHRYGIRVGKVDGTVITALEEAALDLWLRSLRIDLFLGTDEVRVLELAGLAFLPTQSGPGAAVSHNAPQTFEAWQTLNSDRLIQGIPPLTPIKAKFRCMIPTGTPAALGLIGGLTTTPAFIAHFVMASEKAISKQAV